MFGPPEVITGRLMSGAGAGPMTAASGEFTAAATAYEVSIDRMTALLAYLSASWQGPAAMAMQRAVVRFIVAMRLLQSQVALAATRTAAQAAAFTEAYATMAQMVEIVENRVTTATLIATNFIGQNTIPIGVREGQYLEMWMQDVAVQTNYLGQTVANTTFEPFLPLPPIAGIASFPSVITQAINSATAATDRVTMAATKAQNAAALLKGQLGMAAGSTGFMAERAQGGVQKAEAEEAVARNREGQLQQDTTSADKLGQQLLQDAPQQAASLGQEAFQAPQQALQQVQQVGQQAGQQFGSQIGNLMSQVSPEHRLDNPGFFDTQPSSSTLDRMAGSSSTGGMIAAMRVPSLAGLSGASTGFRFPSGWDGPLPAAAAAPPPSAPPGDAPMAARPMGSGLPLRGRRRDEEDETVKRPDTELIPMWGNSPEEPETVTAGALATAELRPDEEEAT
jgi:PPE-repeat protein